MKEGKVAVLSKLSTTPEAIAYKSLGIAPVERPLLDLDHGLG